MYADRHARSSTLEPRSLGIAVVVNGAIAAVLLTTHPVADVLAPPKPPLTTYNVPNPPPDDPPPPRTPDQPRIAHQSIAAPIPRVELPLPPATLVITDVVLPRPIPSAEPGPVTLPEPAASPALVLTAPEVDPAHRGDLQPTYPDAELRAEREGVVTVRVLVGVDGRVHAVEQAAATSDAFFRATRERALARWRFRPATRGGVPVEAWRSMTIRFVIPR